MAAPQVNPLDRDRVPAADAYQAGQPVWVHRHGGWNPGLVREASPVAVLVDYHVPGQRGLLTDTVMELYLMGREDPDPLLDTAPLGRGEPTEQAGTTTTDGGGGQ